MCAIIPPFQLFPALVSGCNSEPGHYLAEEFTQVRGRVVIFQQGSNCLQEDHSNIIDHTHTVCKNNWFFTHYISCNREIHSLLLNAITAVSYFI